MKENDIATMVMMRGMGFHLTEIAEQLDVTKSTIGYRLKQLKENFVGEPDSIDYFISVVGPLGIMQAGVLERQMQEILDAIQSLRPKAILKPVEQEKQEEDDGKGFEGLGSLFG
jgi:predicted transcriptional regulator